MAGLRCSFIIFLLALGLSENTKLEENSISGGEISPRAKRDHPVLESKKPDESLVGKNAISQLMSDSAFFPTEAIGEQIIGQKVLEIVKNPVNVDLNKLPSDVIDKIAEGGVTTPRTEARPAGEERKTDAAAEVESQPGSGVEATATTTNTESSTTVD